MLCQWPWFVANCKLAWEKALLFGQAKRGKRECASERRSRARFRLSSRAPLARLLFTISPKRRACSQANCKLKKQIRIDSSELKKKLTSFVLQLSSGYGIYAGFQGAKTLISLKDDYREYEYEGGKVPIDYKYYKGLCFSLQSWRTHRKFRRWKELSSSVLSFFSEPSYLIIYCHIGPYHFLWTHLTLSSRIRLNHRFIWNLAMLLIY